MDQLSTLRARTKSGVECRCKLFTLALQTRDPDKAYAAHLELESYIDSEIVDAYQRGLSEGSK